MICKVAAHLRQFCISGFYTEEIREFGVRRGFRLVTFNNEQAVISHVNFDHHYHVGKYGVDVSVIDRFADSTLIVDADIDIYIVDEIGKMECLSPHFVSRIQELLGSNKPIVASVAKQGDSLIKTVKQWPNSELWEVTCANRNQLPSLVVDWLQYRVARG